VANDANIKAVITADDKASSVLRGFSDNVSSAGSKIASVAKVAAEATLAAGAAAAGFGALSVKAYMESQDAQAQLKAVLDSTHHAAGLYIEDLNDQAAALQRVTKFSDEQINASQAMLLTFTNIRGEIFQRTTPVILDLATAMHEDLQSASIQVGKALNDPVTGITALHRIGVTFSDTQKQQIQHFVDTNQLAKAQGVILTELQKEFGGSAVAAGDTFGGKLEILKNKLNDVEEQVGHVIVNALTPFANKALDAVASVDWTKVLDRTIDAIKRFYKEAETVAARIYAVARQVWDFLFPSLEALWNTLNIKVIPMLVRLWHEVIEPILPVIGTLLVGAVWLVINALNVFLSVITPVITFLLDHKQVVIDFALAFGALALYMKFESVTSAFLGNMNQVMGSISSVKGSVTDLFTKISGGTVMGGIAVGGALADIGLVAQAVQSVMGAINAMNNARNAAVNKANSDLAVVQQLSQLIRTGTPEQRARAQTLITKYQNTGSFASGVTNFEGGLAYVHQGELLVNLPPGTDVIPKSKVNLGGGQGNNISITVQAGAFMGSQLDARKYAQQILQALQDVAAAKNMKIGDLLGVND
jgi:hypothetical protein